MNQEEYTNQIEYLDPEDFSFEAEASKYRTHNPQENEYTDQAVLGWFE